MKIAARVLVALVAALGTLFASTGTSHAGLDNELSVVDGKGRTMVIQQWDTFLNGVYPLDRNRLTREWFHSGRAIYHVTGPGADAFAGTLELGYQIGFPWSLGVGVNFSYTTPNINLDQSEIASGAGAGRDQPAAVPGRVAQRGSGQRPGYSGGGDILGGRVRS